ncbi:MAG: PAS domain S-box protein [Methanomicrobiaceae archaeon]|nr:PAS domain S-box protein [Methanomicrobiaceae archaeon]
MMEFPDEVEGILALLSENPKGLAVSDIAAHLGMNRNTAARYLDMLQISGQAEMRTYGRAKVYYPSRRVPISAMLDFSSDLVAVLDRDLNVVQVNDAICSFSGADPEAIIGKSLSSSPLGIFDHPLIRAKICEGIAGEEYVKELEIRRGLEDLFFRFKVIPMVFNDGTPGVTLLLEDVTQDHRSLEAITKSELLFRTLVEEINDIIWNIDEEGVITYVSPPLHRVLGYDPDEVIGRPIAALLGPEDAAAIRTRLAAPAPFALEEFVASHREEGEVILESSGTPVHDDLGEFTGFRIVSRDVTDRNAAERRIRQWKSFLFSIVENIPAKVLVKEVSSGKYVFFNRSAEKFFGRPKSEIMNAKDADLFSPGLLPLLGRGDDAVIASLSTFEEAGIPVITREGTERILRIRKLPIFSASKNLKYILTIGEDITERRRAEEEMRKERDLAQSYLDVAAVMITVVDRDGIIVKVNRKGCEILGYEEGELEGCDWFTVIAAPELKGQFIEVMKGTCLPPSLEVGRIRRKDGTEKEVLWRNALLRDAEGRITALVASGEEVGQDQGARDGGVYRRTSP